MHRSFGRGWYCGWIWLSHALSRTWSTLWSSDYRWECEQSQETGSRCDLDGGHSPNLLPFIMQHWREHARRGTRHCPHWSSSNLSCYSGPYDKACTIRTPYLRSFCLLSFPQARAERRYGVRWRTDFWPPWPYDMLFIDGRVIWCLFHVAIVEYPLFSSLTRARRMFRTSNLSIHIEHPGFSQDKFSLRILYLAYF